LTVNDKELEFLRACIATGAKPKVPDIKGIRTIKYYTSETIFNMETQPKSLAIIGGGPIAAELG